MCGEYLALVDWLTQGKVSTTRGFQQPSLVAMAPRQLFPQTMSSSATVSYVKLSMINTVLLP